MANQPSRAGLPPRPRSSPTGADTPGSSTRRSSGGGDASTPSSNSNPRRSFQQSPLPSASSAAAHEFMPRGPSAQMQPRPSFVGQDVGAGASSSHAGAYMPHGHISSSFPSQRPPPFDQGNVGQQFYAPTHFPGGGQAYMTSPQMQHQQPQSYSMPQQQPPQQQLMPQHGFMPGQHPHMPHPGFAFTPHQPMPAGMHGFAPSGPQAFQAGQPGPPPLIHPSGEPPLYARPPQPGRATGQRLGPVGGPSSPRPPPQPRPMSNINVARQNLAMATAALPTMSKMPRMTPIPPLETFLTKRPEQPPKDDAAAGPSEGDKQGDVSCNKVLVEYVVFPAKTTLEDGPIAGDKPQRNSYHKPPPVEPKDPAGAAPESRSGQRERDSSRDTGKTATQASSGARSHAETDGHAVGGGGGASGGSDGSGGSGRGGGGGPGGTAADDVAEEVIDERIRRLYAAMVEREEQWALCVEALGFQPGEAWRVYRDTQMQMGGRDGVVESVARMGIQDPVAASSSSGSTMLDQPAAAPSTTAPPPREPPAPILGVRLLQQIDTLRRENGELSGFLERRIGQDHQRGHGAGHNSQDADLRDAHNLIEALDAELTRSRDDANEQRRRADRAEEALRAACESQSRGWGG